MELSNKLSNPLEFVYEPMQEQWEKEYKNGSSPKDVLDTIVGILKCHGFSVPSSMDDIVKGTESVNVDKLVCVAFYVTCYMDIMVKILVYGNKKEQGKTPMSVHVSRGRELYETVALP